MDFGSAIQTKMRDIENGSTEPFIIYRDNGGEWHCDYTQNQYGDEYDWVEDVTAQDPFAIVYTGKDFSKGSFPTVYDTVLYDRIRSEYYVERSSGRDTDNLNALTCFFYDKVSKFSSGVTDYLTTLERPLAALSEMCPFNLTTGDAGWSYNEDLADDAIDRIENAVSERLHVMGNKTSLTAVHCLANTKDANFTGKLLVVKADALMPEYRDADSQIVKCTHGNGARPNAKGRSIFCKELASDKTVVYYRNEIEGIADIEKLPQWAKRKLLEQSLEQTAIKPNTPDKKPSLLGRLDDAKAEAEAHNAGQKLAPQTKKRGDMEVD